MGNATHYGAEHESGDEGEEEQVDEAFQPIVAQPRHGLDVVLRDEARRMLNDTSLRFEEEHFQELIGVDAATAWDETEKRCAGGRVGAAWGASSCARQHQIYTNANRTVNSYFY